MSEAPEVLNLADADTTGFDPIPSGTYKMEVVQAKWEKTKGGENAKMPAGTDQLNVQFKVIEDKYNNRRVFTRYTPAPPEGYDSDSAKKMKGMFVRFLEAAGLEGVKVDGFKFDPDDLTARELYVTVNIKPADDAKGFPAQNRVTGVKSLTEGAVAAGAGSGLL